MLSMGGNRGSFCVDDFLQFLGTCPYDKVHSILKWAIWHGFSLNVIFTACCTLFLFSPCTMLFLGMLNEFLVNSWENLCFDVVGKERYQETAARDFEVSYG